MYFETSVLFAGEETTSPAFSKVLPTGGQPAGREELDLDLR